MTFEEVAKLYEEKFDENVPLMFLRFGTEEDQKEAIQKQIDKNETFSESLNDELI